MKLITISDSLADPHDTYDIEKVTGSVLFAVAELLVYIPCVMVTSYRASQKTLRSIVVDILIFQQCVRTCQ